MKETTKEKLLLLQQGDRRALSRVLSWVEEQDDQAFEILEHLFEHTGQGASIGITGPAGAGKSTLIDQMIRLVRDQDKKISVLAVDPSSPFSGGAVLGDRVRMQRHCSDEGVFIRSVGSRGKSGGVSFATRALLHILDVFGSDYTLVETVGAGQSEVDIMHLVDTTVVVLTPESGDSIQALKAGMLEIANVFVINKSDRDGATRVAHDIQTMLSLVPSESPWTPPIIMTSAQTGDGVDKVLSAIEDHQRFLADQRSQPDEMLRRRSAFLFEMIQTRLAHHVLDWITADDQRKAALSRSDEPNLYKMVKEGVHALLKR